MVIGNSTNPTASEVVGAAKIGVHLVENPDVVDVGVAVPGNVNNYDNVITSRSTSSCSVITSPRPARNSIIVRGSLRKVDSFGMFDVPVDNDFKSLIFNPRKHRLGSGFTGGTHHRAFWFATLSFFVAFLGWFAWAPLIPTMRVTFGLCDNQSEVENEKDVQCKCEKECKQTVTTAISMALGSTIFARVVLGTMLEYFGPVKTQAILLSVGCFGVILLAASQNIAMVMISFVFLGVFGATFVTNQVWTTLNFAPAVVGLANACAGGWGNVGGGAAQLFGVVNYLFYGPVGLSKDAAWRWTLAVPLVIILATVIAMVKLSQDTPRGKLDVRRDFKKSESSLWDYWYSINNLNVILLSLHYSACFGAELAVNSLIAVFYVDEFQVDPEYVGILASSFGFMNLFARSIGGGLSDRLNKFMGVRGRLWAHFLCLLGEGVFLFAFSQITKVSAGGLGASVTLLIIFSVFVQAAEGTTYALVPFVLPQYLSCVSAYVGAGGNLGALIFVKIFFTAWAESLYSFRMIAVYIIVSAFSVGALHFGNSGSLFKKPKFADFCHPGIFNYCIEWASVDNEMKVVGHYECECTNLFLSLWRIFSSSKNDSFATLSSAFRFPVEGVGNLEIVKKTKLPRFVQNSQRCLLGSFKRKDLAINYGIRSILYVPTENDVLELGSCKEFRLLPGYTALNLALCAWTHNIANVFKYVELVEDLEAIRLNTDLSRYCKFGLFSSALEWRQIGQRWVVVNHFVPSWRMAQKRKAAQRSSYALQCYGITLPVTGDSVLRRVSESGKSTFVQNVQMLKSDTFMRLELAKQNFIRSCFYLVLNRNDPSRIIELVSHLEVKLRLDSNVAQVTDLFVNELGINMLVGLHFELVYEGHGCRPLRQYCRDGGPFVYAIDWLFLQHDESDDDNNANGPEDKNLQDSEQEVEVYATSHFDRPEHVRECVANGFIYTYSMAVTAGHVDSKVFTLADFDARKWQVHAEKKSMFFKDVGSCCEAKTSRWLDLVKTYGIKSVLYLPTEVGVIELGTTVAFDATSENISSVELLLE